jgi:hypothetical protein
METARPQRQSQYTETPIYVPLHLYRTSKTSAKTEQSKASNNLETSTNFFFFSWEWNLINLLASIKGLNQRLVGHFQTHWKPSNNSDFWLVRQQQIKCRKMLPSLGKRRRLYDNLFWILPTDETRFTATVVGEGQTWSFWAVGLRYW